eukprot:scaffold25793_cov66-Phaeocystis_antarctica.AAC.2
MKSPWNQIPRTKYQDTRTNQSAVCSKPKQTTHDSGQRQRGYRCDVADLQQARVAAPQAPGLQHVAAPRAPVARSAAGSGASSFRGYRRALLWLQVCSRPRRLELLPWLWASATTVAGLQQAAAPRASVRWLWASTTMVAGLQHALQRLERLVRMSLGLGLGLGGSGVR